MATPRVSAGGGHPASASSFYLRACHYYQMGERFRTPKLGTAVMWNWPEQKLQA